MNPIPEEDDNSSDSPRNELITPSATPQRPFLSFEESITPPEEEVAERSSLTRWMDFKSGPGRMQEGGTRPEAFPVLVRGLEVEAGPMARRNSISKETTPAKRGDADDSPNRSRDAPSFTALTTELLKQRTVDSGEDDEDWSRLDDLPPAAAKTELALVERIEEMQKLHKLAPEDLLLMAISEQESAPTGRRQSIWRKLGSKHKVEDDFVGAIQELQRVSVRLRDLDEGRSRMEGDLEELRRAKEEQETLSAEMTDKINSTNMTLKDVRRSKKTSKDMLMRDTELQLHFRQRLLEDQSVAMREAADALAATSEGEERWLARVEELHQVLLAVETSRAAAVRDRQHYQTLIQEVVARTYEFEEQQLQIELCLELLGDAMDYFAQSQEHIEFNAMFCKVLNALKQATFEAIAAEKEFAMQALTDPRELMPYKRASDHVSGTY